MENFNVFLTKSNQNLLQMTSRSVYHISPCLPSSYLNAKSWMESLNSGIVDFLIFSNYIYSLFNQSVDEVISCFYFQGALYWENKKLMIGWSVEVVISWFSSHPLCDDMYVHFVFALLKDSDCAPAIYCNIMHEDRGLLFGKNSSTLSLLVTGNFLISLFSSRIHF